MRILFWKVQCQHQIVLAQMGPKTSAMTASLYSTCMYLVTDNSMLPFLAGLIVVGSPKTLGSLGLLLMDQVDLSAN